MSAAAPTTVGSDALEPVLADAFAALDAAGVRWCLLRDPGPRSEPNGDVDLLVAPRDRRRAEAALERCRFTAHPRRGLGSHRFRLARDDGHWTTLDIVTDLAFGPHRSWRALPAEEVLARRVRDQRGVARPDDDDLVWLVVAHGLLDRGRLAPTRLAEARRGVPHASLSHPVAVALDRARPAGVGAAELRAMVERGDEAALATVGAVAWPSLLAHLSRRARALVAVRTTAHRLRNRLGRTGPLAPTGLTVALLAPDGAGKSTISAVLHDHWPLPVRVHYLGLYPAADPWVQRGPSALRPLRRLARTWVAVAAAERDRSRGHLVVLDRHPCEARLDDDPRPKARLRRLVFGRLVPAPDLVLVLDAPAELLAARKPEHSVDELAERRERYLALAGQLDAGAVIDTSGDLAGAVHHVVDVVWAAWRTRRGR